MININTERIKTMIKHNYSGKFIVIEGLDGSGHTSQTSLLANFLIKNNYKVFLTKEPTQESKQGKKIREILSGGIKISNIELQKLFAEDRKWHLKNEIIPALREGKIVISDRYYFSSFAYGSANGIDLNKLIELNKNFLFPDLTFILEVNPKICIKRIEKRGEQKELFEKKEQLEKVWEIYKGFNKIFNNIIVINGENSIENVFEDIKKCFLENNF